MKFGFYCKTTFLNACERVAECDDTNGTGEQQWRTISEIPTSRTTPRARLSDCYRR